MADEDRHWTHLSTSYWKKKDKLLLLETDSFLGKNRESRQEEIVGEVIYWLANFLARQDNYEVHRIWVLGCGAH